MDPFDGKASGLVREIRAASGIRQAELARRAGLPRSVLCAYEKGARQPGVDALSRIAAAAGMDLAVSPRHEPVDPQRAGRILEQVLELAEALPFKPGLTNDHPPLAKRLA